MDMREPHEIEPIRIEHAIDEVWNGESLDQRYNFLDYHFERDGACCRARSYADAFESVTLYGPFDGRGSLRQISSPGFERDVTSYLERRFSAVRKAPSPMRSARIGRSG